MYQQLKLGASFHVKTLTVILTSMLSISGCSVEEPVATKYKRQAAAGDAEAETSADQSPQQSADTPTLSLTEPIDSTKFSFEPNPNVDGKTLAEILTSQTAGRDDGLKCSACHNEEEAAGGYGVAVAVNGVSPDLSPTQEISGKSWVEEGGWADTFVVNETKPDNLKTFIQAWIDGGFE
jgi:hypothetical protein